MIDNKFVNTGDEISRFSTRSTTRGNVKRKCKWFVLPMKEGTRYNWKLCRIPLHKGESASYF